MSLGGMLATMTVAAATALSSHKADGVRQRIEAAGAQLLCPPSYAPNLNPIEKAWPKCKQLLGSPKARTEQALDLAITQALQQISAENAQARFR